MYSAIAVALIGAVIGAFADRFSYWFHVSRGFLWRKHCPHCFTFQAWITYVPVLGHVLSRGTCFTCKERLPLSPWIAELACAGMLTVLWFLIFNGSLPTTIIDVLHFLLLIVLVGAGAALAISDLVYDELPMGALAIGMAAALTNAAFGGGANVLNAILAGVFAAVVMGILVVASDWKWVHGHDIALGIFAAVVLGMPAFFVTLAFTYIFAIMGGVVSWGWKRPVWRGVSSFGPYLFAAIALQCILSALSVSLNV